MSLESASRGGSPHPHAKQAQAANHNLKLLTFFSNFSGPVTEVDKSDCQDYKVCFALGDSYSEGKS